MTHEAKPVQPLRVWDLPLRIFHWGLALAVVGALVTGWIGGRWMDWHGRLGILILGLLGFRLIWGLVGSTHARFSEFLPTPGRIRAYLRGEWQGVGHNPLGALSVFGLLGVLAVQVGSGLFANDDIAFQGPLYPLIDKALSDACTGWHRLLVNLLLALVALHVAAILFYAHVKGENLVRPMLTGIKQVPAPLARPVSGGGPLALVLALLLAATLAWGLGSGSLTRWLAPPPPPAVALPAW
jgi:cytochrome b